MAANARGRRAYAGRQLAGRLLRDAPRRKIRRQSRADQPGHSPIRRSASLSRIANKSVHPRALRSHVTFCLFSPATSSSTGARRWRFMRGHGSSSKAAAITHSAVLRCEFPRCFVSPGSPRRSRQVVTTAFMRSRACSHAQCAEHLLRSKIVISVVHRSGSWRALRSNITLQSSYRRASQEPG